MCVHTHTQTHIYTYIYIYIVWASSFFYVPFFYICDLLHLFFNLDIPYQLQLIHFFKCKSYWYKINWDWASKLTLLAFRQAIIIIICKYNWWYSLSLDQVITGTGLPSARHLNVIVVPSTTVWSSGDSVKDGGTIKKKERKKMKFRKHLIAFWSCLVILIWFYI